MAGKGSYIAENRELAFKTWRECGENIELTIRTLKDKHALPVTKPTLYAWMEKFGWKERATRAQVEEQHAQDAVVSSEGKILTDLERQRQKYERYFDSLGERAVDPNATYAYNSLTKTIVDIKTKTAAYKATLFLDFYRDLIEWLSKNDPDSLGIFERNFDDFIAYAKEKYAR